MDRVGYERGVKNARNVNLTVPTAHNKHYPYPAFSVKFDPRADV